MSSCYYYENNYLIQPFSEQLDCQQLQSNQTLDIQTNEWRFWVDSDNFLLFIQIFQPGFAQYKKVPDYKDPSAKSEIVISAGIAEIQKPGMAHR